MKLWLADFQRIGGVFTPITIVRKYKTKKVVYGRLLFPATHEQFFLKVELIKGAQPVILRVCSSPDNVTAYGCLKKLLKKRSDALSNNTNDIRSLIRCRRGNIILWLALFTVSVYVTHKGFTLLTRAYSWQLLCLSIISLGLLLTIYHKRHYLIRHGFLHMEVLTNGQNQPLSKQ